MKNISQIYNSLGLSGIIFLITLVLVVGGIGDALLERFVFPRLQFFDNKAPIIINRREEVQINDGLNNAEIINRVKNSAATVYLGSGEFGTRGFRAVSVFSGAIVASDGIIAVSSANLKSSIPITVILADGRDFPAAVMATDSLTGLAFLKIAAEGLPVLNQGSSSDLRAGEKVLSVWAEESPLEPLAEPLTVMTAPGLASSFTTLYNTDRIDRLLSTTGSARQPGAVVVNRDSALVGFVTGIGKDTVILRAENFSLAVSKLLEDKKISWVDPKLTFLALSEVQTKILGFSKRAGVQIRGDAGVLQDGDFIYGLDDFELTSPSQFQDRLLSKRPGDTLKLKLIRAGQEMEVEIKL